MVTCAGDAHRAGGTDRGGLVTRRRPSPAGRGAALALGIVLAACARGESRDVWSAIRERAFLGFLERNPITSTYLGGSGYSARLAAVDGRLPDVTPEGRAAAIAFYRGMLAEVEGVDPAGLSADDAIDRDLVRAQLQFVLRLAGDLRYHQRSLDTDMVAPFRGVDWQLQQMTAAGEGRAGTRAEWERVLERVRAVPAYLKAVEANLREGLREGNTPDWRMVRHDGVDSVPGHAAYFRDTLPDLAARLAGVEPWAADVAAALRRAGEEAAAAFEALGVFLERELAALPRVDRYAAGETEYEWRLRNNFRFGADRSAAALFGYGQREVEESRALLVGAAREVARRRGLRLPWDGREAAGRSVRAVMDHLARDHPRSDEEMFRIYRAKAQALVEFARRHGMFDLPAEYRLEIVPTPPMLESTLEAAYYPAPPFKPAGIGRFYLTASRGDLGILKEHNVHAVADLCAHEGFPGHDWHHQFMRARARRIANVRWLTPGAVEDSSSMWQDSLAAEGWGLYAEQLMGEPQPGAPRGFYTPEERLYQLKWQLLRAARVRIDVGIHTGRMGFDEAVAYYLENVEFLPGACDAGGGDPIRAAACNTAGRAIYRYSKWPTQAITYNLGKRDILDLRDRVRAIQGDAFSLRAFHERFMEQGTIPAGYFREAFLGASGPAGTGP
jgi:uncharacterized protein (DUF885 family)